ncbi:hypothetical protein HIM_08667 [Hirsutella minnesotensis 3608]|uniref:HTH luxR-type domain-containing protein n=1 Tax=Hirsutella minnesotensis 3608 TaxID=1043627 RepID=A0A0F7ZH27_9HYPO|nr:hypothetical protein HIM_08667 [Hirsutella minnesotensis 3608]
MPILKAVKTSYPTLQVICLAPTPAPEMLIALVREKIIAGFVAKGGKTEETVSAIETILEGHVDSSPAEAAFTPTEARLTPREKEIIRCYLNGMTITQIAAQFHRSVQTVSTQKQNAYRKLGIRSDAELFKMKDHMR